MPLWNEILAVRIPPPPCTVRLSLERAPPATTSPAHPAPPPLAVFDLRVPAALGAGCFADAWLTAAAGPPRPAAPRAGEDDAAPPPAAKSGPRGAAAGAPARLRVAFSLDARHAEVVQRGLWPCGARYLGRDDGDGGGGGGGGGGAGDDAAGAGDIQGGGGG
jgi:hypothetical protein